MIRTIRFSVTAAIIAGCMALVSCNSSDSSTSAPKAAHLDLVMDAASCQSSPTVIARDEVDGVDITYHYSGISLTPGKSYRLWLTAPATFRVRFTGFDATGVRTETWDFQTTLADGVDKTETLHCAASMTAPAPRSVSSSGRIGSPVR